MNIDLAISPCPNDTFIFYHLIQKGISSKKEALQSVFADVEELNRRAIQEQKHVITKISFSAMFHAQKHYELLNCGGAMGHNCGPLLISHENINLDEALQKIKKVAVPGYWTTAKLLLDLFLKEKKTREKVEYISMPYNKIIPELKKRSIDFGLLIHEERFSIVKQKLYALQDLGAWWEMDTKLPIPLGCIALRKDFSEKIASTLEKKIRESIEFSYKNIPLVLPFIKNHAQTLDEAVIQAHIKLYVNKFSFDFGEKGKKAIQELFTRIEKTLN